MAELRVPSTIDDVTSEWLDDVLDAGGSVIGLEVEPVGVGIGVMALLYRCTPTWDGSSPSADHPSSVVVKLASTHEPTRQVARGYRFYEREVAVYRDLAGQLALRPPRHWYAGHDLDSDDFAVVMEDLSGLRVCSQVDGCTIDDACVVVSTLARHHAQWWCADRLLELPYIQSPADPPYPQFHAQSTKDAWLVSRDAFGHVVPPELHEIAERWGDIGPALMESYAEGPWTFGHGDVRLDNVFFRDGAEDADGASISVVDWQIGFRTGGAFDLAYFLCQSLAVDDRREHEDELLRRYHDGLLAGGVTDYGWDELRADYRRSVLFSFAYPLSAAANCDLVNDRAVELVAAMLERTSSAILDLDATRDVPA